CRALADRALAGRALDGRKPGEGPWVAGALRGAVERNGLEVFERRRALHRRRARRRAVRGAGFDAVRLAKRAASAAFEQPPDQQGSDGPEGGHGAEVGGAEHLPERALSVARREQRSLPLRQALGRRTALAGEDPVERRARLQALRPGLDPRGVQREQAP